MSAFWSSLSRWDLLTVAGTTLVLIGVVGGFVNRRRKFKYIPDPNDLTPVDERESAWNNRKTLWEDIWEGVLIFGLVGDLVVIPHQLRETSRLNKEAGDAREEAGRARLATANVESNNLELAQKLAATQKELVEAKVELGNIDESITNLTEPMIIGDVRSFGVALTNFSGIHVTLASIGEPNAQTTVLNLQSGLGFAGWNVAIDQRPVVGMLAGVLVGCNTVAHGQILDSGNSDRRAARSLIVRLNKYGIPARQDWPRFQLGTPPSNTIIVAIGRRLPSKFVHVWKLMARDDELDMQAEAVGQKIAALSNEKARDVAWPIEMRNLLLEEVNLFEERQKNWYELMSTEQQLDPERFHLIAP
jgi:hypothetical protein